MTLRTRKLLGVVLLLACLVLYAGLAVGLYVTLLTGQPTWLLMLYFAVAGLGWMFPAMAIVRWMVRPESA